MNLSITQQLGDEIKQAIAPGAKMKNINKEDLRESLVMLKERTTSLNRTLSSIGVNERKVMAASIFKASTTDKNNIAAITYCNIARAIGKADMNIAFDSAIFITGNYVKLLDLLDKSVSNMFTDKTLNIYNTKLSHLVIFGLIKEIELFVDYTVYLCDGITSDICQHNGVRELPANKPYRLAKLNSNQAEYIDICKVRLTNTATSIAMEVDKIKKNLDVNLVSEDNTINTGFMQFDKLSPMIRRIFGLGSAVPTVGPKRFAFFRWFGEQWELMKYSKYQKAKKEKEWLEAHVALLQLDAQGADPNSDEYRRLVKVIESYNEMIAELDQKIDTYMNAE